MLTTTGNDDITGTRSPTYELFMLVLCLAALAILLLEGSFRTEPEILTVLNAADTIVCVIFLLDFVVSLVRAKQKWRYFFTWGWLDLISAIPALDVARWGRVVRIIRLTRVLRALRATRQLSRMLFRERKRSAALAAALVAFLLIVGSSAAILRFEDEKESNIRTANDAVWWAFTTITTVGYGDKYPMTGTGRFIAGVLMTAGVGLFGAFSATLAAWFIAQDDQETNEDLAALRADVAALRTLLDERLPENAAPR